MMFHLFIRFLFSFVKTLILASDRLGEGGPE